MLIRTSLALAGAIVVSLTLAFGSPTIAQPAQPPSGTIELKIVQAGFIVGVEGGGGTLTYKGTTYPVLSENSIRPGFAS